MDYLLPDAGSDISGGIMFHHFHGGIYKKSPGSLSAVEFDLLLDSIDPKYLLSADIWLEKFLAGQISAGEYCLTFDDNLKCQYDIAVPILQKRNLKAFWFIHTAVFEGNIDILELYRRFRTEYFIDHDEYYKNFLIIIDELNFSKKCELGLKNFNIEKHYIENPYLSLSEKKFRFVRDYILSRNEYINIMNYMINYHKVPIKELSKNLYMSENDIKDLSSSGHLIGLHSHNHPTKITELDFENHENEYKKNFEFISKLVKKNPIAMSHPCNIYDQNTFKILNNLGIKLGFRANILQKQLSNFELPRHNHTNLIKLLRKSGK